jgi:hypothetical protein
MFCFVSFMLHIIAVINFFHLSLFGNLRKSQLKKGNLASFGRKKSKPTQACVCG